MLEIGFQAYKYVQKVLHECDKVLKVEFLFSKKKEIKNDFYFIFRFSVKSHKFWELFFRETDSKLVSNIVVKWSRNLHC